MDSKTENRILETTPSMVFQFLERQEAEIYNSKFLLSNKTQPKPKDLQTGLLINRSAELIDTLSHTPFTTFENKFVNPRPRNICAVYSFFCSHDIEAKLTNLILQNQVDLGKIHEYTFARDYGENNYFSDLIERRTFSQTTNIRSYERCIEVARNADGETVVYSFIRMTIDFGLMEIERFASEPKQGTLEATIPGSFNLRAG